MSASWHASGQRLMDESFVVHVNPCGADMHYKSSCSACRFHLEQHALHRRKAGSSERRGKHVPIATARQVLALAGACKPGCNVYSSRRFEQGAVRRGLNVGRCPHDCCEIRVNTNFATIHRRRGFRRRQVSAPFKMVNRLHGVCAASRRAWAGVSTIVAKFKST
jgi:hypothetical protein